MKFAVVAAIATAMACANPAIAQNNRRGSDSGSFINGVYPRPIPGQPGFTIAPTDNGGAIIHGPGGWTIYNPDGRVCNYSNSGVEGGCNYYPEFDFRNGTNSGTNKTPQGGSTGSGSGGKACTSGYTMTNGIVQCGSGGGGQKR